MASLLEFSAKVISFDSIILQWFKCLNIFFPFWSISLHFTIPYHCHSSSILSELSSNAFISDPSNHISTQSFSLSQRMPKVMMPFNMPKETGMQSRLGWSFWLKQLTSFRRELLPYRLNSIILILIIQLLVSVNVYKIVYYTFLKAFLFHWTRSRGSFV